MKIIKGKLKFISLFQSIELTTNDGIIDLRDIYFNVFKNLNGENSVMNYKMNEIEFVSDANSDKHIEYENEDGGLLIILRNNGKFGYSNIGAYLPDILQRLNGMEVILTYSDDYIKIEHDIEENVPEMYYTHSNSCKVENPKELCKIGENDCCIFCTAGGDGFVCLKFDTHQCSLLLDRYSKGTMRASRIGNCKIVGRKLN